MKQTKILWVDDEIEILKFAIYIHEIGKIVIPNHINKVKETELPSGDLTILKRQSYIGSKLLEQEEGFEKVANHLFTFNLILALNSND